MPCRGISRTHESPNHWMLGTALSPARYFSNITPSSAGSLPTPREPCSLHRGHSWQRKRKCALSFQLVPEVSQTRHQVSGVMLPLFPLCPHSAQCSHGVLFLLCEWHPYVPQSPDCEVSYILSPESLPTVSHSINTLLLVM